MHVFSPSASFANCTQEPSPTEPLQRGESTSNAPPVEDDASQPIPPMPALLERAVKASRDDQATRHRSKKCASGRAKDLSRRKNKEVVVPLASCSGGGLLGGVLRSGVSTTWKDTTASASDRRQPNVDSGRVRWPLTLFVAMRT